EVVVGLSIEAAVHGHVGTVARPHGVDVGQRLLAACRIEAQQQHALRRLRGAQEAGGAQAVLQAAAEAEVLHYTNDAMTEGPQYEDLTQSLLRRGETEVAHGVARDEDAARADLTRIGLLTRLAGRQKISGEVRREIAPGQQAHAHGVEIVLVHHIVAAGAVIALRPALAAP